MHQHHHLTAVRSAGLAPAQLAFVDYARYTARRSPLVRTRWVRPVLGVLSVLAAAGYMAQAFIDGRGRILAFALAGAWVVMAVMWTWMVPRSMARLGTRLARLQAQITERYGTAPPTWRPGAPQAGDAGPALEG